MSDLDAIQSVWCARRAAAAGNGPGTAFWHGLFHRRCRLAGGSCRLQTCPHPSFVPNAAGIFAILCILGGFARGWFRQPTLRQTARCLDDRQHLQERLSTALELAPTGPVEGWRALLVSDAARFAAKLDPRKIFPYRLPRVSRWALAALALGAGLGFVPEYRTKAYVEKQQEAQVSRKSENTLSKSPTRLWNIARPPWNRPARRWKTPRKWACAWTKAC
jgi:hypothetical protein